MTTQEGNTTVKTHIAIVAYIGECCSAPHVTVRCITRVQAESPHYLSNLKKCEQVKGRDVGDCFIIEASARKDIQ